MGEKSIGTGFRYATMLYEKLVSLSKEVPAASIAEFGYPIDDPKPVRVFQGYIYFQASADIGLSRSSHSSAVSILTAMRCITNLRQGGPNVESVYILNYQLTEEQYREYRGNKTATSRYVSPSRYDTLINEIETLKTKYKNLERRIKDLEGDNGR